jgi:[acyl-carrier-protein] S-malonyltransferase
MNADDLSARLSTTVLAYRGYNEANLGRSHEFLERPDYGPTVQRHLNEASEICSQSVGRQVDLVGRVQRQQETTLETYAEAICLIVAIEQAQLELAQEFHGIEHRKAAFCFGYSLGEIAALVASGVLSMGEALQIPLSLADDCVALSEGVSLGILFSHRDELSADDVKRLCMKINCVGQGVMGISAYLSPNSMLLMGQGDTIDRFRNVMKEELHKGLHLKRHPGHWPPLHTPIVWQKNITDRARVLMQSLRGSEKVPEPPLLSLATGEMSYNDCNFREILARWIDQPQHLWDAVYQTLGRGTERVLHIGPSPNIVPATFARLASNVESQTEGRIGMHVLKAISRRPWLQSLLPSRTALLRAPNVEHVILEDWLLEQPLE